MGAGCVELFHSEREQAEQAIGGHSQKDEHRSAQGLPDKQAAELMLRLTQTYEPEHQPVLKTAENRAKYAVSIRDAPVGAPAESKRGR